MRESLRKLELLGNRSIRPATQSMTHPEQDAPISSPGNPPATNYAPDRTRRMLLGGLLSGYTASLIPWAVAQPVADTNRGAFLAISAILAGRKALDPALAKRLYDALVADDPKFPGDASALLALINQRGIDPMSLQGVLDAEKSSLASVPRRIAGAWFLGIVGSGERAVCIAYEDALNAVFVADVLKPPTYCYGAYGSWVSQPG